MATPHLFIASHDGILTHYTGVGTVVRNWIHLLNNHRSFLPPNCRIHLATIAITPASSDYSTECKSEALELTTATGGALIQLSNGVLTNDSDAMWGNGDPKHWKMACEELASAIERLVESSADPVVVLCHDADFLYFQKAKEQLRNMSVHTIFFPHSTGINHGRILGTLIENSRITYERDCFNAIARDPTSMLSATGEWFEMHLAEAYDAKPRLGARLPNGLVFERYERSLNHKASLNTLQLHCPRVTASTKVVFAWGRCSRVKGFLPLIRGWKRTSTKTKDHLLILQMPDQSGESDYLSEVRSELSSCSDCVLLDDFNPDIWRSFLRSPQTEVVCIPSLADPNPHTPLEAKFFATGMRYAIVASHVDGIVESFAEGEALFVRIPHDPEEWARVLSNALELSETQRMEIAETNSRSVRRFDYSAAIHRFADQHINPSFAYAP